MHIDHGRQHLLSLLASNVRPRFAATYCSQCGTDIGPGDSGVSACSDHLETDDCPECDGTGEGPFETACRGCRGSGAL